MWDAWNKPEHIKNWAFASKDWMCPAATNDLRVGGRFVTTMAAKDGSASFDFGGIYSVVETEKAIAYTIDDGRAVSLSFESTADGVRVIETFDPENVHPADFQRAGWQAILDNFKTYAENLSVSVVR